jgi:hypothetical protein
MTSLMLLAPSTVEGLPAVDVPGSVNYVADAPSLGQAIVVTAPLDNDDGTAEFRLFYRPPDAMVERPIVSFEQSLSGYPSIGFAAGARPRDAHDRGRNPGVLHTPAPHADLALRLLVHVPRDVTRRRPMAPPRPVGRQGFETGRRSRFDV